MPSSFGTVNFVESSSTTSPSFNSVLNDLIVIYVVGLAATHFTPSDTAGNTYTSAGTMITDSNNYSSQMWYCLSSKAKTGNVVTISTDASVTFGVAVWDTPVTGTATFDVEASGTGTTGTIAQTNTFNTTGTDEIVFVGDEDTGASGRSQQAGYTADNLAFGVSSQMAASHGRYTSTQTGIRGSFTILNGSIWGIISAAFKGTGAVTNNHIQVIWIE